MTCEFLSYNKTIYKRYVQISSYLWYKNIIFLYDFNSSTVEFNILNNNVYPGISFHISQKLYMLFRELNDSKTKWYQNDIEQNYIEKHLLNKMILNNICSPKWLAVQILYNKVIDSEQFFNKIILNICSPEWYWTFVHQMILNICSPNDIEHLFTKWYWTFVHQNDWQLNSVEDLGQE